MLSDLFSEWLPYAAYLYFRLPPAAWLGIALVCLVAGALLTRRVLRWMFGIDDLLRAAQAGQDKQAGRD